MLYEAEAHQLIGCHEQICACQLGTHLSIPFKNFILYFSLAECCGRALRKYYCDKGLLVGQKSKLPLEDSKVIQKLLFLPSSDHPDFFW